jgi:UDP-glucuronate decarboxylase
MRVARLPELNGPVNLGNPAETTIKEIAELVLSLVHSNSTLTYCPLPADDPRLRCPDITRARELFDFAPRVALEVGLAKTIDDFRARLGGTTSHDKVG